MASSIPKYAQLEYERRFLVSEIPDLSGMVFRLIEDLYLDETRLRLRKITHLGEQEPQYKLCKKYHGEDANPVALVNIYLTEQEYDVLCVLQGKRIRKRRYNIASIAPVLCIDVFEGHLAGLMLCELEAESAASLAAYTVPQWIGRDVSDDPFFRGGNLASIDAAQLMAKLSSIPPWSAAS
jgi:CYTH domain-containing protein